MYKPTISVNLTPELLTLANNKCRIFLKHLNERT